MSWTVTRLRDALKDALDSRFGALSGADATNRLNAMEDIAQAICDEGELNSGGGGGGAPDDATYVTASANGTLTNELILGSAVIMSGTLAARPAASIAGRLYYTTDASSERLTRDNGSSWDNLDTGWSTILSRNVVNADVNASAGIAESKLALNFATHTSINDPTAGEKAALVGTSGAPGSGNKYVTDADSRMTNARTPTAHAASHDSVGSDPITITESQVTNLVSDLAAKVPATRNINTTAPLSGGGDLSADRTLVLDNDGVTFAKMQNISTDRLIGRDAAATGDPEEISVSGGLEFTGTAAIQRSALTGDITASAGSNATSLANNAVTYAKMQDVSAATRLLGRGSAGGAGDPEEITLGSGLVMTGTSLSASVGGGGSGVAEIDFGSWPGKTDTTLAITGQAAIVSGSVVQAWLYPKGTTHHSLDEHVIEEIDIYAGNILVGTGFTIYATTRGLPLYGLYSVAWRWN